MRGMKSDDLLSIVEFLYRGEANVFQENLNSFLDIAEELQLKGLIGRTDEKAQEFEVDEKHMPPKPPINPDENILHSSLKRKISDSKNHLPTESGTLTIPSNFSEDFAELEEKVKSLMEKSQNNVS